MVQVSRWLVNFLSLNFWISFATENICHSLLPLAIEKTFDYWYAKTYKTLAPSIGVQHPSSCRKAGFVNCETQKWSDQWKCQPAWSILTNAKPRHSYSCIVQKHRAKHTGNSQSYYSMLCGEWNAVVMQEDAASPRVLLCRRSPWCVRLRFGSDWRWIYCEGLGLRTCPYKGSQTCKSASLRKMISIYQLMIGMCEQILENVGENWSSWKSW